MSTAAAMGRAVPATTATTTPLTAASTAV
jgi:hypothetical protein